MRKLSSLTAYLRPEFLFPIIALLGVFFPPVLLLLLLGLVPLARFLLARRSARRLERSGPLPEAVDVFSLEGHEGPYEQWSLQSMLYYQGQSTGTRLVGYNLGAQYKRPDGCYVLVVDMDCPFEEMTYVILLGPDFRVLDESCLGDILCLEPFWLNGAELIVKESPERAIKVAILPKRTWGISHLLVQSAWPGKVQTVQAQSSKM